MAKQLQNSSPVGYDELFCNFLQWGTMSQVIGYVGQDGPPQVFPDQVGICKFYFDNEYIALFLVYDLIDAVY